MLPILRRGPMIRFGRWDFDPQTGELFKGQTRVHLQDQPSIVLSTLLKRSGELVTREELYRLLWAEDTHVDYDHALNIVVAKVRRVLNDSADKPRYVETIPKRGYRFIAQAQPIVAEAPPALATPSETVQADAASELTLEPTTHAPPIPPVVEPEVLPAPAPFFLKWYWLVAIGGLLFVLGAAWLFRPSAESVRVARPAARFEIQPKSLSGRDDGRATISPDGNYIVYASGREDSRLWLRAMDKIESVVLQGTESARKPFWSPDSQTIVFATDYELRKISVQGGPVARICELPNGNYGGGTWNPWNETIVFSGGHPASLFEAPASGGEPKLFAGSIATGKGKLVQSPRFLPKETGRRALLIQVGEEQDWDIAAFDLDTNQTHVLTAGIFPEYAPGPFVIYQTAIDRGGLWALPFSLSTFKPTGVASSVLPGAVDSSVDVHGTLVASEAPPEPVMTLTLRDRQGNPAGAAGRTQTRMVNPGASPDGRYVAVMGRQGRVSEIWLHGSSRSDLLRLSAAAGHFDNPVWAPSSEQLIFRRAHRDAFELYRRSVDPGSSAVRISSSRNLEIPVDWSDDGKYLLVSVNDPKERHDVWYFRLSSAGDISERHRFFSSPADEIQPVLSPNGQWLAYCSDATGAYEVYVKPFPTGAGVVQVSTEGGCQPRWSYQGDELFYVRTDTLFAARFQLKDGKPSAGVPQKLFASAELAAESSDDRQYDVASSGRGFYVVERVTSALRKQALIVIQDWSSRK